MVPSRLSRLQTSASAAAPGSSAGRQVKARPQSSNEKSRPWWDREYTGSPRGSGCNERSHAELQIGSHHVQDEDAGVPQDVSGHHLGENSREQSVGTGQAPHPSSLLESPPDLQPPRTHQRLSSLTVYPARALRCSAATSKAFRVAPPLPRLAQGSSTARSSAGGRGPSPPRSRRTSSSAKREAGGVESRSRRRTPGGRRGARPATCLAAEQTRRHGPAGR